MCQALFQELKTQQWTKDTCPHGLYICRGLVIKKWHTKHIVIITNDKCQGDKKQRMGMQVSGYQVKILESEIR